MPSDLIIAISKGLKNLSSLQSFFLGLYEIKRIESSDLKTLMEPLKDLNLKAFEINLWRFELLDIVIMG